MKPLILITNDDGVFSPGLRAAAEAVAGLGELIIAAPRHQQTGMSRALRADTGEDLIEETTIQVNGCAHPAYGIHATPALVVVYAAVAIAPRPPDLCISGINYGENIGMTISASGTVGAALEAAVIGIPALAVSRGAPIELHQAPEYRDLDWTAARGVTRLLAERILRLGLPPGTDVLNVNVPAGATERTEIRPTVQSRQRHVYFARPQQQDAAQGLALSLANLVDRATLEPDSDIQAFLIDNVVSVSPLTARSAAPTTAHDLLRYVSQE